MNQAGGLDESTTLAAERSEPTDVPLELDAAWWPLHTVSDPRSGRTLAELWRASPDHARTFERVDLGA